MTEPFQEPIPTSLADMLPVGMISGGGTAGAAMAIVAQRKRGVAGWEAFHYERLSATEFEITGGIAVNIGGVKKFQGAHDTVNVTETEVLEEMHTSQKHVVPSVMTLLERDLLVNDIGNSRTAHAPQFLKVVFALPDDEPGRQRILQAFQLQANFFGAKVQACSLHDK
ncbi:hypothetical protein [Undibacterium sp. SXout20W]|uniref:hypothetical protein n=1 Tax=Undibacterium sp. SXout20W TaxID=3413051 RepID=UPI003BF413C7